MATNAPSESHPDESQLDYSESGEKYIPDDRKDIIEDLAASKGFSSLTETQEQAFMEHILGDGNKLLVAQTGNGKTFVAEASAKQALANGERVAYLVPSRQLVKEKLESIHEWTGDDVAVAGPGDSYRDGDIVVKTFDSFFTALINNVTHAVNLDFAVFDDFHELYSTERGAKIEQSLAMAMQRDITVFAMSATIGNPKDIAGWFDADLTVSDESRCKPLDERPIDTTEYETKDDAIVEIVTENPEDAPFLVFNNSRRAAKRRADKLAQSTAFTIPDDAATRHEKELNSRIDGDPTSLQETLIKCLKNGVAFHHAGVKQSIQEYITEEFGREGGHINVISCTPTLAYGFDSDVQTVIVGDLQRFNGKFMEPIGVYEYVQWIGRAARQGTPYDEGIIYPLYSDENVLERFQPDRQPQEKELEPITSKMEDNTVARKTFLQLIHAGWETADELDAFLERTLLWYYLTEDPTRVTDAAFDAVDNPDTALAQRRDDVLNWLDTKGFVTQRAATKTWDTTALGAAAVRFFESTWVRTTVENIHDVWHAFDGEADVSPGFLLEVIAEVFDHTTVGVDPDKQENDLDDWVRNLDTRGGLGSEPALTAAMLIGAWCRGVRGAEFKNRFGATEDDVSNASERHAKILNGLEPVIQKHPDPQRPDWFEGFIEQLEHGVRPEILSAVTIPYVGRVRAFSLDYRLSQLEGTGPADDPWERSGPTLLADLYRYVEYRDDDDGVVDSLSSADMIGSTTANSVVEYVRDLSATAVADRAPRGVDVDAVVGAQQRDYEAVFNPATEERGDLDDDAQTTFDNF